MKLFKEPEYLERFKKLEVHGGTGALKGDTLLLEVLEEAEERKSKGGIILKADSHVRSEFDMFTCVMGIILQVGEGEDGKSPDYSPGTVVEVSAAALTYKTTHPLIMEGLPDKKLAAIIDKAVLYSWPSMDDYESDVRALNPNLELSGGNDE